MAICPIRKSSGDVWEDCKRDRCQWWNSNADVMYKGEKGDCSIAWAFTQVAVACEQFKSCGEREPASDKNPLAQGASQLDDASSQHKGWRIFGKRS